jgi:hypothetical protein
MQPLSASGLSAAKQNMDSFPLQGPAVTKCADGIRALFGIEDLLTFVEASAREDMEDCKDYGLKHEDEEFIVMHRERLAKWSKSHFFDITFRDTETLKVLGGMGDVMNRLFTSADDQAILGGHVVNLRIWREYMRDNEREKRMFLTTKLPNKPRPGERVVYLHPFDVRKLPTEAVWNYNGHLETKCFAPRSVTRIKTAAPVDSRMLVRK